MLAYLIVHQKTQTVTTNENQEEKNKQTITTNENQEENKTDNSNLTE